MQKNTVKTMIGGLVCLVLFNIGCGPGIGTNTNNADDAVPIRDQEGGSLTRDELVARLSTGEWIAEPVHDEYGAIVEIVVSRSRAGSMHGTPDIDLPPGAMMIDGSTPIRTEDGESLSPEEFMARMDSGVGVPSPSSEMTGRWWRSSSSRMTAHRLRKGRLRKAYSTMGRSANAGWASHFRI